MILFSVLWPLLLGYLLVYAFGRGLGTLTQVCLAPALGMGAISCCFFLELESGAPSVLFELLLLVGAGAACWKTGWRRRTGAGPKVVREPWLVATLALVLAGAAYGFFVVAEVHPHGTWDAWAIWNLHARFLVTADWRDLFSGAILWTHPDYPLLLSGFIARVWSVGAERDLLTPRVVAFLFTFGAVGLLGGAVGSLKGRRQGMLAALFLAATPTFFEYGASQCADIPISLFILAALALPAIEDRDWPENRSIYTLAGLCAGMAAWTKNEGLLLVALAVPIRALAVWRRYGGRAALGQTGRIAAGLAPVLAVVLFFRITLAPANAHLGGRSLAALSALFLDAHRWRVMLVELVRGVASLGGFPVGTPLVLAAYLVCVGLGAKRDRTAVLAGFATLAALLAGYCTVCVLSPYEIRWQTDSALPRLLLQLWPSTIFLAFLAAGAKDTSPSTLPSESLSE